MSSSPIAPPGKRIGANRTSRFVFRASSAERRTILFGYVGFFETYFDGDVEIEGDRAVGRLMQMAFSGAYRYRDNPLLLAKRTYLEWRNNNQDFARAKAIGIVRARRMIAPRKGGPDGSQAGARR